MHKHTWLCENLSSVTSRVREVQSGGGLRPPLKSLFSSGYEETIDAARCSTQKCMDIAPETHRITSFAGAGAAQVRW